MRKKKMYENILYKEREKLYIYHKDYKKIEYFVKKI